MPENAGHRSDEPSSAPSFGPGLCPKAVLWGSGFRAEKSDGTFARKHRSLSGARIRFRCLGKEGRRPTRIARDQVLPRCFSLPVGHRIRGSRGKREGIGGIERGGEPPVPWSGTSKGFASVSRSPL